MTEAAVVCEVQRLCDLFRLHEWDVLVEAPGVAQLDSNGKVGLCVAHEESMACEITVAAGRPDAEVLETCLHEVLHLALRPTVSVFNAMIDQFGQGAWNVAKRVFEESEEKITIRLTRAINAMAGGVK